MNSKLKDMGALMGLQSPFASYRLLAPTSMGSRPCNHVQPWNLRGAHSRCPFQKLQKGSFRLRATQPVVARLRMQAAPAMDVISAPDSAVSLGVREPAYEVRIVFDAKGRDIEGAQQLWAHAGHSGWQDTLDVEMENSEEEPDVWEGTYRLPAGRLVSSWHMEMQVVFKALVGPHAQERWDNNGGANWAVVVELTYGEGLVLAPKGAQLRDPAFRELVSSLLLGIEVYTMQRSLTVEQGALLRTLAWQHDFALLRMYKKVRSMGDAEISKALAVRCGFLTRPGLHVVHIASEMAPIAKVGGLADVVSSLAKAHQATGTLAEIILPKYDCINYRDVGELRMLMEVRVEWGKVDILTSIWSGVVEGLPVYFIEPRSPDRFFWRGAFYGEKDDNVRFLFFSKAAMEFLLQSGKQPDVLHVHDWQSASVAPLLHEEYRERGLSRAGVVLTIHNIAFQGWLTPDHLDLLGMSRERLYTADRMLDDMHKGFHPGVPDLNLMKGGIVYSDRVTTVSPTYSREVFDPHFGMGLQGVLAKHGHKFSGVLNGIDHETWNPLTDPSIPAHFSAEDPSGKEECKRGLLQSLGLPYTPQTTSPEGVINPGRPLLAIISRLTDQKGLPLILRGIYSAIEKGAQVVLLGGAPDPVIQRDFEKMAHELSHGPDARFVLRYDEGLSHRIYAGADMILIPSFFEPCGLTQLISLRYGTIPIVRSTGGLADTVRDVAHSGSPEHERNGFAFSGKATADVDDVLNRAISSYSQGYAWWRDTLVPRAMKQDWSWSRSAQDYLNIYRSIVP